MTTKQVLQLDCRSNENKEIIQRVLRQIKPLSKYSDECEVPSEAVEKAITVMSKKYNMRVQNFAPDIWSSKSETIWRATIIDDTNLSVISNVYGISLYELLSKVAIQMYARVKSGEATLRGE